MSEQIQKRRRVRFPERIEITDEYDLDISENRIAAFNTKNRRDWSEKIFMYPKGASRYISSYDYDIKKYFYKAKDDECFDYLKNRIKKLLEKSGVNRIDERTLYELFHQCYELKMMIF